MTLLSVPDKNSCFNRRTIQHHDLYLWLFTFEMCASAIRLESRTIYWIEAELMDPSHGKHSLTVEIISGTALDEGSSNGLLELCARESGVWPAKIPLGGGNIL